MDFYLFNVGKLLSLIKNVCLFPFLLDVCFFCFIRKFFSIIDKFTSIKWSLEFRYFSVVYFNESFTNNNLYINICIWWKLYIFRMFTWMNLLQVHFVYTVNSPWKQSRFSTKRVTMPRSIYYLKSFRWVEAYIPFRQ